MPPVRVLVVAPDILTRAGLAAVISGSDEFSLAGQSDGSGTLADDIELSRPDVVVWEIPRSGGFSSALRDLGVPVVAVVAELGTNSH